MSDRDFEYQNDLGWYTARILLRENPTPRAAYVGSVILAGTGNSISTWVVDTEILSGGYFRLPRKQWLEFIRNAVD
jgi:hypothetical protein